MTIANETWIKEAQAALDETAEKIAQQVPRGFENEGRGIVGWWEGLSPETRSVIKNALIGGAAGAGILGGAGYLMGDEGEKWQQALQKALIGGAGGALAGGTGTAAYNLMTGGRQLPGEIEGTSSIVPKATDEMASRFLENPLMYAGGALGGAAGGIYGTGAADAFNLSAGHLPTKGGAVSQVDVVNAINARVKELRDSPNLFNKLQGYMPGAETQALRRLADASDTPVARAVKQVPFATKGRLAAMGIPLGLLLGYAGDRVLRGDYE